MRLLRLTELVDGKEYPLIVSADKIVSVHSKTRQADNRLKPELQEKGTYTVIKTNKGNIVCKETIDQIDTELAKLQ